MLRRLIVALALVVGVTVGSAATVQATDTVWLHGSCIPRYIKVQAYVSGAARIEINGRSFYYGPSNAPARWISLWSDQVVADTAVVAQNRVYSAYYVCYS